jgi:glutamate-1-semialdehyde 2,1-aminomutase
MTLAELIKKHKASRRQVIGEPPLFDILFTDAPAKDYRDTLKADKEMA